MKIEKLLQEYEEKQNGENEEDRKAIKKMEKNNAKVARNARKKLEKAAALQKTTVDEIKKQNESLEYAKKDAIATYKSSKNARNKANELLYEKNIFTLAPETRTWFKNWLENSSKANKDIKSMEKDKSIIKEKSAQKLKITDTALTEEEKKTNEELKRIYDITYQINKQTDEQKNESKKQKTKLNDMIVASKYAQKEIEQAGDKLDDFNDESKAS